MFSIVILKVIKPSDLTYSTFLILSVGTCAAEPQNPRYKFALYGATKSYNHILSSGLEECYGDKIDVMTVIPRQTKTKMNPADYLFTVSYKFRCQRGSKVLV